jgi:hypothetical protein
MCFIQINSRTLLISNFYYFFLSICLTCSFGTIAFHWKNFDSFITIFSTTLCLTSFQLTGQTGFFGTVEKISGRDKRDSGHKKVCPAGLYSCHFTYIANKSESNSNFIFFHFCSVIGFFPLYLFVRALQI